MLKLMKRSVINNNFNVNYKKEGRTFTNSIVYGWSMPSNSRSFSSYGPNNKEPNKESNNKAPNNKGFHNNKNIKYKFIRFFKIKDYSYYKKYIIEFFKTF
jgi:hypothetical protein